MTYSVVIRLAKKLGRRFLKSDRNGIPIFPQEGLLKINL